MSQAFPKRLEGKSKDLTGKKYCYYLSFSKKYQICKVQLSVADPDPGWV
jgi:hypothetical protein